MTNLIILVANGALFGAALVLFVWSIHRLNRANKLDDRALRAAREAVIARQEYKKAQQDISLHMENLKTVRGQLRDVREQLRDSGHAPL